MGLTRSCDGCGQTIEQEQHIEVTARVLKTHGTEEQDTAHSNYGDFCDGCIASGDALKGNYILNSRG